MVHTTESGCARGSCMLPHSCVDGEVIYGARDWTCEGSDTGGIWTTTAYSGWEFAELGTSFSGMAG